MLECQGQDPLADAWVEKGKMQRADGDEFSFEAFSLDATVFEDAGDYYYVWQFIESGINQKFGLARFRLFREQVNGGLDDCCEVMYDGVPYSSLNNGMRINIGVDVIRTISEHYGIRVPLVVDNAESVTRLLDAGTQVIRLVVRESDQELRCEYGA